MTVTAGTELEPVSAGAIALAKNPFIGLDRLADEVVPVPEPTEEARPFPNLPKLVELTTSAKAALGKVAKVFGSVSIRTRRALTAKELTDISDEVLTIAEVKKVLEARDKEIREIIRVHMDVDAEERGAVAAKARRGVEASPRDRNGHYLLGLPENPFEVPVPGLKKGWSQRYVSGGTTTAPSPATVALLLDDGRLSRAEYLAVTREVRAFDPDKALAFIRKNPERGLAILRELTSREEPNSSLYLPER